MEPNAAAMIISMKADQISVQLVILVVRLAMEQLMQTVFLAIQMPLTIIGIGQVENAYAKMKIMMMDLMSSA